jgi:hypothetical protein
MSMTHTILRRMRPPALRPAALAPILVPILAPILALVLALGLAAPGTAHAALDYALLDAVLVSHVRDGWVDYDGVAADPRFPQLLEQLAAPREGPAPPREEQLALRINAYNVFAIKGVLDGYSPSSWWGRRRFFGGSRYRLEGRETSLEGIEKQDLRALREPRVHFALVCASLSCPRLRNAAWRPEGLDAQLDEAARRFVNDPVRNRFDIAQRLAMVSELFSWYEGDFARDAGSVPAWLARYADEGAVRAALSEGRLALRYQPYDWQLNGTWSGPAGR